MLSPTHRLMVAVVVAGSLLVGSSAGYWLFQPSPRRPSCFFDFADSGPVLPRAPFIPRAPAPPLFAGKPKPEAVLLLSGQTNGYLVPCGCARPQLGGLERRQGLLEALRERGWPVLASDLGDITSNHWHQKEQPKYETPMQSALKFDYTLEALQIMNYVAIGFGANEIHGGLTEALNAVHNAWPPYLLGANWEDKAFHERVFTRRFIVVEAQKLNGVSLQRASRAIGLSPFSEHLAAFSAFGVPAHLPGTGSGMFVGMTPFFTPPPRGVRVAYLAAIADSVANRIIVDFKKEHQFVPLDEALPPLISQAAAFRPDVIVLLLQGNLAEARAIAEKHPELRLIHCLASSDQAPALPQATIRRPGGDTLIVEVGTKGKSVALVGVVEGEKGWELIHETVDLTDYFDLPDEAAADVHALLKATAAGNEDWLSWVPEQPTNPIRDIIARYVRSVAGRENRDQDSYLIRYPRTSHSIQASDGMEQAAYVGADACKDCHRKAYDVWKQSKHSHAYDALVHFRPWVELRDRGKPPIRIGRQYDPTCAGCHTTGFDYKTGYVNEQRTPQLKHNQCENCHGPASLHVATAQDPAQREKYAAPLRINLAQAKNLCERCHDGDNDPHFNFDKYWPKIRHSN